MKIEAGMELQFDYTNWKGEIGTRNVCVYGVMWGSNEWHQEEQWLLQALDKEKGQERYFAMKDMSNVTSVPNDSTGAAQQSLLEMQTNFKNMQRQLKTSKGRKYFLPLSIIESPSLIGDVWCEVEEIDLSEDVVLVTYKDPEDGEEMSASLSISEFADLT